jgi:flavin reductase (DIM6/NTAB) family NADH-FMN oxidoreductase RutF
VARAPVAYECKLHDILEAGANRWITGSVQVVHIDEAVYVGRRGEQDHRIDLLERVEMRPVGRLGRANYVRVREVETRLRRDGPNG